MKLSALTGALLLVAGVSAIPREPQPWIKSTGLDVQASGDGGSDGNVFKHDEQFRHTFVPLGRPSSQNSRLPSSAPFRSISVTPRSAFQKRSLRKHEIQPRLALDKKGNPNYLTRYTVSKDAASTTQDHVNQCTQFCDRTVDCAMASVIRFNNFPEGNVICAVFSATQPKSDAKYTTGLFNGPGEVKASYTFNRNAGKVPPSTTTTATQGFTTVRTSTAASTPTSTSCTCSNPSPAPSPVYDQWVWVDVPGTTCSDGSQTGFALNLHQGSEELVIGYQQGGSCYDYNTCYVERRAYNMQNGFKNSTFWSQNQPNNLKWWFPFARDNQWNPWQQANYAWIPYCTGDFHAGDNVVQYSGASSPTYHKGWQNGKLDMVKLRQLLPNLKRVWIAGSSAGAFGSILQYQNAQDAFAGVRIDLLADSGETPLAITVHPSQNIQVPNKSRCPNCNDNSFDSYIVGLAQANPGSRFASMSWSNDTNIPPNQGLSYDSFSKELVRLFNEENTKTTNAKNFMVQGSGHILLYTTQYNAADGYTQATFLNKFKTDDPYWSSH